MNKLQNAVLKLLESEPFYASFVLNSTIKFDSPKEIPTAYATVQNGTTVIGFNSKFMEGLTIPQLCGVLKHEVLHLLFDHVDSRLYKITNQAEKHNWNIAMDCAINQYIQELPEGGVRLADLEKSIKTKLLPWQSAQYYYDMIQQAPDSCKQAVGEMETTDEHGMNEQMSPEDAQIAKGIVHKKAQEAVKNAKGLVPKELVSAIENLLPAAQVNWKQMLRNFIANATSRKTQGTRKKANRRFDLDQPGKKKKRELKIAVCIDSSGSVSDKMFSAFIGEIQEISKHITEAHLIYADCVVQNVIKIDDKKKIPLERYGNGGTAYQPAIDKAMELKCDAILYMGDFDCADKPEDPKKPFLWVGIGHQEPPGSFGKVIRINEAS